MKRGDKCLVHFLMMPDSQDNWGVCYPETDTPEDPEERAEQYHVSVDWVLEAAQYNEWLNEEDFQLLENGKIKPSETAMTYDEFQATRRSPRRRTPSGNAAPAQPLRGRAREGASPRRA